jgi:bifunctional non-homologous end joining protein LigD
MAKKKSKSIETDSKELLHLPKGAKKAPMPVNVKPMLAEIADAPFDDENWLFEIKWDGYRAITSILDGKVSIASRNGQDYTKLYSTITRELTGFPHNVVFDGEVVYLNDDGTPNFDMLQNAATANKEQLTYMVFDLIWYDGHLLTDVPLLERKELLSALIAHKSSYYQYNDHIATIGKEMFNLIEQKGLEGIVAKRKDSLYNFDKRSKLWLKIRHMKHDEYVIGGWAESSSSRPFGSLYFGRYDGDKLVYEGHSGGGFKESERKEILKQLDTISDFKAAFEALTPGRQRGYILYFAQPKQSKTREARIIKYMPLIFQGKGLNDDRK